MTRLTLSDLSARYQAQVLNQRVAPELAPAKPILRQSAAPKMNKSEAAYLELLRDRFPGCTILPQAITLRLGNGCRYTPDFAIFGDGLIEFHEVKGHMRDDAAVKIKVAAALLPRCAFWLAWLKAGQWQHQRILA